MRLQSEEQNSLADTSIGRVVMISGSFPPMPCGVGDSAFELAKAIASKGVDLTVITDKLGSAGAIPAFPIRAEIENWGLSGIGKLVRLVESMKPDVVHIHYPTKAYGSGLAVPFLPMMIHARRRPFRLVVTLHEFKLSHRLRRLASFILLDPCDAVVMPCQLEIEALQRRHASVEEKIIAAIPVGAVGPSPDSISADERAALRARVRAEWRVSDDDVVLIHYGTPSRSKGIEVLFKAMRLLKLEGLKPVLVMVGECQPGDEAFGRTVKGQSDGLGVKEQLRWLGRVPESDLPGIFSAADIGVFPFLDGFSFRRSSLVALLMWDLPIVTTEPDGELIEVEGQDKVKFVARGDPKALATGLISMIANPKALELARSAANPLKEYFRWDRIAEEYIDIYKQVRKGTENFEGAGVSDQR